MSSSCPFIHMGIAGKKARERTSARTITSATLSMLKWFQSFKDAFTQVLLLSSKWLFREKFDKLTTKPNLLPWRIANVRYDIFEISEIWKKNQLHYILHKYLKTTSKYCRSTITMNNQLLSVVIITTKAITNEWNKKKGKKMTNEQMTRKSSEAKTNFCFSIFHFHLKFKNWTNRNF